MGVTETNNSKHPVEKRLHEEDSKNNVTHLVIRYLHIMILLFTYMTHGRVVFQLLPI